MMYVYVGDLCIEFVKSLRLLYPMEINWIPDSWLSI